MAVSVVFGQHRCDRHLEGRMEEAAGSGEIEEKEQLQGKKQWIAYFIIRNISRHRRDYAMALDPRRFNVQQGGGPICIVCQVALHRWPLAALAGGSRARTGLMRSGRDAWGPYTVRLLQAGLFRGLLGEHLRCS